MSDDPSDPNAPLPPDAPPHVKAFYDTVNKLIEEISASDPVGGNDLTQLWEWMVTHVPERFLRPRPA